MLAWGGGLSGVCKEGCVQWPGGGGGQAGWVSFGTPRLGGGCLGAVGWGFGEGRGVRIGDAREQFKSRYV